MKFTRHAVINAPALPDEEGQTFFARMRYRGTNITLNRPRWDFDLRHRIADSPPHFVFYLYVDNVAATGAAMTARGAALLLPADPTSWGDLRDPFGYLWDIAQPAHTAA